MRDDFMMVNQNVVSHFHTQKFLDKPFFLQNVYYFDIKRKPYIYCSYCQKSIKRIKDVV